MPLSSVIPVTCIGAIHADTLAHALEYYRPETSTPAYLTVKPGGVATNVARNLTRLGTPAALIGAVGQDGTGETLTAQLAAEGLHLHTAEREGYVTGQYIAFHNPDGSLAAASVDDRVLSEAPADLLNTALDKLDPSFKAGIWFADANLPVCLLEAVASRAPEGRLIANAVSNAKAPRLRQVLPALSCLMLNRGEAIALTAATADTSNENLVRKLQTHGVQRLVLTDGKADVLAVDGGNVSSHAVPASEVVDVTGAGDALTAGMIAALSRGKSLTDAVPYGLKAAAITLQGAGALSEALSWSALNNGNPIF